MLLLLLVVVVVVWKAMKSVIDCGNSVLDWLERMHQQMMIATLRCIGWQ